MTPYQMFQQMGRATMGGRNVIRDPGSGGTVIVMPTDRGILQMDSTGARTLQTASQVPLGTQVLCLATASGVTVNGTSIADGNFCLFAVTLSAAAANQWTAIVSSITGGGAGGSGAVETEIAVPRFRIWDALDTQLSATAASADDLALAIGTFGTTSPYLTTTSQTPGDANPVNSYARAMVTVPEGYVAGQSLTLEIDWGRPDAAATSATLDAVVYRAAAPTVDINDVTAAQDVNAAASGTASFVLTATDVVPGEVLNIRLGVAAVSNGSSYEIRLAKVSLSYTA